MNHNRILIVDDNSTNIAILEEILSDHFPLATAASGEEALAKAVEFRPEVVLLDIMMPGMNGYEVCRAMRASPALRHCKIIMVSARAMVSERIEGYEAGADDYIVKPFDEDELLAKVRIYLRLSYLEEINKLKSDILMLLNHETRTPLNNIIPVIEMLLDEGPLEPDEYKHWLGIMRKHADRLHRLLDKGIRLSAMRSDAWTFSFAATDLCAMVREVVSEAVTNEEARKVVIDKALPSSALAVCDAGQVRSVIQAMLDNAMRFNPPGGRVRIGITPHGRSWRLSVSDEGPGIAPSLAAKVFDEFNDVDPIHHIEGQRLSLALAREIVRAHAGEIGLDSSAPGATTFSFTLPIAGPRAAEASRTEVASVGSRQDTALVTASK